MSKLSIAILDRFPSLDIGLELAPLAEALGYSRYWIAEHFDRVSPHGAATLYSAIIAGITERIRVGTAGILLRYYPVSLAAMQFRLASTLYEGRFDAGFCGGASGHEALLAEGLSPHGTIEAKAERLVAYTRGTGDAILPPADAPVPVLWYLGASRRSAEHAGRLGVSYGYALHMNPAKDDPGVIQHYRHAFLPSGDQGPAACISVAGYCSDSAADIDQALNSRSIYLNPIIVGSPQVCRAKLLELAERYEVNEIVFTSLVATAEPARRCLELLADVMRLKS